MNIKASFVQGNKKVFRRYKVTKFEDFIEKAKEFSGMKNEKELIFQYVDEENDFITFSTKEEFDYCFEKFQKNENGRFLRVNVIAKPKPKAKQTKKDDGIEFLFSGLPFFSGCNVSRLPNFHFHPKRVSPFGRRFPCFNNIRKMQPKIVKTNPFVFKMMKPSVSVFPRQFKKKEVEKEEKKQKSKVMKKEKSEVNPVEKLYPETVAKEEKEDEVKQEDMKQELKKEVEVKKEEIEKQKEDDEGEIMEIKKEKKDKVTIMETKKEEKKGSGYLYQNELVILEKMGFSNTQLNKHLLNLKKGDLRTVVATILSLDN